MTQLDESEKEHFIRMNILFLLGMALVGIIGIEYSLILLFTAWWLATLPLSMTIIFELMLYQLKGMYKVGN